MNNYIVASLRSGDVLKFEENCNHVLSEDKNLCAFVHVNEDGSYQVLGMVPYDNIEFIKVVREEEE